ncbi:hypothetical protein M413DRAFT_12198 [Hebeloma cylindrosporum]|uniref:SPRY domain-containing protein n=1 Tax=Hebeloma cylindrosporum TaxID=76867 RepID=A0A0C2YF63_HEBCY|nr:hypothetical protein M413DRAFT_12198 [Hebeloma cylindrosporum h7]
MIIVCVALIILLGKGTQKAYVHIKRKRQDKKRRKRDRLAEELEYPSGALQGGRRGNRKQLVNTRRNREHAEHHHRGDEDPHRHGRDRGHSNVNLGISSEARASAEAHASHTESARHTYHQRERDLGVAISLRQARRIDLEPDEEEITEELPNYNRVAPPPPSYENCASAPDSHFRGQSNLGSECRMRTVTEPRVEQGVWWSEATVESGSEEVYALRTSYGGLVFPSAKMDRSREGAYQLERRGDGVCAATDLLGKVDIYRPLFINKGGLGITSFHFSAIKSEYWDCDDREVTGHGEPCQLHGRLCSDSRGIQLGVDFTVQSSDGVMFYLHRKYFEPYTDGAFPGLRQPPFTSFLNEDLDGEAMAEVANE